MKTTRNVLFALLLLGCAAGTASAATSFSAGVHVGSYGRGAAVDVGFFYDNLASYGHWIQRPRYGWVWTPRSVSSGWRPYSQGRWVDSDQGWAWVSDEPFGWATYHYGRWYQDPQIGWAWVPGTQWGPAWVSWQEGSDYVGWAPLPPGAEVAGYRDDYGYDGGYDDGYGYDNGYDNGYGYDDGYYDNGYGYDQGYGYGGGYGGYGYGGSNVSVSFSFGIGPSAYLFVPTRYFLSPSLYSYYVPYSRIYTVFRGTRNCTNYRYSGGRYYNHGVPYDHIRRVYGHVPRYQLSELGNYRDGRYGSRINGNRVEFFRPQIQRNARVAPPISRAEARRSVVTADRFRSAYPDRVARGQRDRQPYVQGGQQGQYRNGRERSYDVPRRQQGRQPQVYPQNRGDQRQRTYDVPRQQRDRQYQPYQQNRGDQQRPRVYEVPRQQQDRAERQRAYESQQRRQQQYQQQYQQQNRDRQRAYDYQRGQAQAERQRAYESQRQQQRQQQYQRPQYRNNDRQDRQPQVRGEARGQSRRNDNNSGDNRGHGRGRGNGRGQ